MIFFHYNSFQEFHPSEADWYLVWGSDKNRPCKIAWWNDSGTFYERDTNNNVTREVKFWAVIPTLNTLLHNYGREI